MWTIIYSIRAARRFRGYRPRPLSLLSASRWIRQFGKKDQRLLKKLLDNVIYMSELKARDILVEQNAALMKRLHGAGLPPEKLIYVSVHDAASSSPVLLNLLRDTARLLNFGCRFIDSRDLLGLNKAMNELGEGALIAALCVLDHLEADTVYAFLACNGARTDYIARTRKENEGLINHRKTVATLEMPLTSIESCYRRLAETIAPHRPDGEITLVPMGPKPHVLASILIAMRFPEVACLRVSATPDGLDVKPNGEIVATRVIFKGVDGTI
jgi:hypothetical protein